MKEEFLHYLWKYGLYDHDSLSDNEGQKIVVLHPGQYNRDSGPDFFNARILIGPTEWAGNVEIHTRASHFYSHGHHRDPAFDNVILHVVAENDRRVINSLGEELLTVELKYSLSYYEKYCELINNPYTIACQKELRRIDNFLVRHWLQSVLVERLKGKSETIKVIYRATGNDWDETFYRVLSRYFGFRVNTEPFEMLASAIPFRIIRKHADNRKQTEALLFGTAGMLEEGLFREALADRYYLDLVKEYRVLSSKYSLHPLHGCLWKFGRLRPVNFPTVRISQLAALLGTAGGLFSRITEAEDLGTIRDLLGTSASEYWNDHYVFGKLSRKMPKKAGNQAIDILILNAVIPVIFCYGLLHGKKELCERALSFSEETGPEENIVVREWREAGIKCESAFFTQALLQLTESYCRKRRCLECYVGCRIISLGGTLLNSDELLLEPLVTS
ncbi:MAG: DUF2851 family protein [Bacteroidales bacterium]|jgi:hypothetical protein|nr:DUF2851 family protein [Bacteroidales bacterium]